MSEFLQKQCFGILDKHGQPEELIICDKTVKVVRLLKRWVDTSQLWQGQSQKLYYRLQLEYGQIMEVYYDLAAGEWWTYKLYQE